MSTKSAGAFCRRASAGLTLLALAWSTEAHADPSRVPAPGAVPVNDFAPASPVGLSSPVVLGDASSEVATASGAPARPVAEGGGWSLVIAPFAAAAFAVAWVLARRRRDDAVETPAVVPPTPHEVANERPSVPQLTSLPSISAIPTGSPFTSEPNIVASPATFSEALLVRASVVEAGLFDESIVDVPLTPVVDEQSEAPEAPREPANDEPPKDESPKDERPKDEPSNDEPPSDGAVKLELASSGSLPDAPSSSEALPDDAASSTADEEKPAES